MSMPHLYCWKPGDGENFGDSLGPVIVSAMLECAQPRVDSSEIRHAGGRFLITHDPKFSPKVFSIGSIAHFARAGDTLWGTGMRSEERTRPALANVDIRALRGPLSAKALGRTTEDLAYGDPAMLLPYLAQALDWPIDCRMWRPPKTKRVALIPNLRHLSGVRLWPGFPWKNYSVRVVSPYLPWHQVLRSILESDGVVATSLHGVILAESFGVPVEWISSPPIEEGTFKFRDYFLSTGRLVPPSANAGGIIEALERLNWRRNCTSTSGKESVVWDPKPLWDAFPWTRFGVDAPACPFSNIGGMPGGQQNQEHPKCAA